MTALRQQMIEDMVVRGFAQNTQTAYVRAVARLVHFYGHSLDRLSEREIQRYLVHLRQEKGLSYSTCNQVVSALRFFYQVTLGRSATSFTIPAARTPSKLPQVLSREELTLNGDGVAYCLLAGAPLLEGEDRWAGGAIAEALAIEPDTTPSPRGSQEAWRHFAAKSDQIPRFRALREREKLSAGTLSAVHDRVLKILSERGCSSRSRLRAWVAVLRASRQALKPRLRQVHVLRRSEVSARLSNVPDALGVLDYPLRSVDLPVRGTYAETRTAKFIAIMEGRARPLAGSDKPRSVNSPV